MGGNEEVEGRKIKSNRRRKGRKESLRAYVNLVNLKIFVREREGRAELELDAVGKHSWAGARKEKVNSMTEDRDEGGIEGKAHK